MGSVVFPNKCQRNPEIPAGNEVIDDGIFSQNGDDVLLLDR